MRLMMKLISILFSFILLMVALAVGIYTFLPGLKNPIDLGINTDALSYDHLMDKLDEVKQQSINLINPELEASFNEQEVTTFFEYNDQMNDMLKDVQVKITDEDTLETAASVSVDYVLKNILNNQITEEEIVSSIPLINQLPEDVNLYAKFNFEVKDNELTNIKLYDLNIMGFDLSQQMIKQYDVEQNIMVAINQYLKTNNTNTDIHLLAIEDGKVIFKGKWNK